MPRTLRPAPYRWPHFAPLAQYEEDVLVIGAGAAGLFAGELLRRHGVKVTVLEAADRVGGRLCALDQWADFPVEMGAEFLHSVESFWHALIWQAGFETYALPGREYALLNNRLVPEAALQQERGVAAALALAYGDAAYKGRDISVADYLKKHTPPARVQHLLEGLVGEPYGTDNARLSLKGLLMTDDGWEGGEHDLLVRGGSLLQALQYHTQGLQPHIVLNTPVTAIDATGPTVRVSTAGGKEYTAAKVIVAVPLTILKRGRIHFAPALPVDKQAALDLLGMDAGLKLVMRFHRPFWPMDCTGLGTQGHVLTYYPTGMGRSKQHLLTGFAVGTRAEALSAMGTEATLQTALKELDTLFHGKASKAFLEGHVMDWTTQPYIEGAYSYPKVGISLSTWAQVAAPINRRLYFAGEHTHTGWHYQTVHGALETGLAAVKAIAGSLGI